MGQSGLHGKQLNAWNSHGHCYETSQIIKVRVIVLQGNRGMVLLHRMSDLRSHPPWFSSTAVREKEIFSLSWSCRKKKTAKEVAFLGGTRGRSWITGWSIPSLIHCSRGTGCSCWQMCPLRYSLNAKQKAATLQTRGRVCHVKCKIQGAKGSAQVPKGDCKVTRERKAQGAHNERGLCSQLN